MRLLLDTHVLVWWAIDDKRLSGAIRALIEDESRSVLVSPAAIWEMSVKHAQGRWPDAGEVLANVSLIIQQDGFEELPITMEHARAAGALAGPHKDPFDRLLIAQAIAEDASIVSFDRVFAAYPVPVLWP